MAWLGGGFRLAWGMYGLVSGWSWAVLDLSWPILGRVGGPEGPNLILEYNSMLSICFLGRPWLVLGCLWPAFGHLGSVLGESGPVWVSLGLVLMRLRLVLGRSWPRLGCLEPVLGSSWGVLGCLGQSWRPGGDFGGQSSSFKPF